MKKAIFFIALKRNQCICVIMKNVGNEQATAELPGVELINILNSY